MLKKFDDYESTQTYGNYEQLPKGGYVVKILGVEVKNYSGRDSIVLSCDIAEGDYKDHFAKDYRSQEGDNKKWHCTAFVGIPTDDGSQRDGWTKRAFKTFTKALEDSNEGYSFDWDEKKFKGKLVGGLFNIREYEGNDRQIRQSTSLSGWTSVEKIRSGNYKLPKDKLLERKPEQVENVGYGTPVAFSDEDLPF